MAVLAFTEKTPPPDTPDIEHYLTRLKNADHKIQSIKRSKRTFRVSDFLSNLFNFATMALGPKNISVAIQIAQRQQKERLEELAREKEICTIMYTGLAHQNGDPASIEIAKTHVNMLLLEKLDAKDITLQVLANQTQRTLFQYHTARVDTENWMARTGAKKWLTGHAAEIRNGLENDPVCDWIESFLSTNLANDKPACIKPAFRIV